MIREYLQQIHRFSKRLIIAIKTDENGIQVNGNKETVRFKLKHGDILKIQLPKEKISDVLKPEKMKLDIIYEDDAFIVVNKPAGMATIPAANHLSGTLANGLLGYYEDIGNTTSTIHVVTRLDRDTSGLVLIAKNKYSHALLSASQRFEKVNRTYVAVVEGILQTKVGIINKPIGRRTGSIIEREVHPAGKKAITNYQLLDTFQNHSFVNIQLKTGRTHQIRVHFSHIGHPLAGDDLYGGSLQLITRQALHCAELRFEHPITRQLIELHVDLPTDLQNLIEYFKKNK